MITFPCKYCQAQLTFEDRLGGSNGLCPHCHEMIYIPKLSDAEKGIQVSKSSFSPALSKFVKTKASDIDDDVTDNKFLVPEERKSKHGEKLQKFIKTKASDIDDDITDNKFLYTKEQKSGLPPAVKDFVNQKRKDKRGEN